jgi:hypothetical protein
MNSGMCHSPAPTVSLTIKSLISVVVPAEDLSIPAVPSHESDGQEAIMPSCPNVDIMEIADSPDDFDKYIDSLTAAFPSPPSTRRTRTPPPYGRSFYVPLDADFEEWLYSPPQPKPARRSRARKHRDRTPTPMKPLQFPFHGSQRRSNPKPIKRFDGDEMRRNLLRRRAIWGFSNYNADVISKVW